MVGKVALFFSFWKMGGGGGRNFGENVKVFVFFLEKNIRKGKTKFAFTKDVIYQTKLNLTYLLRMVVVLVNEACTRPVDVHRRRRRVVVSDDVLIIVDDEFNVCWHNNLLRCRGS